MIGMKTSHILLVLFFLSVFCGKVMGSSPIYPFVVEIGEQKAEVKGNPELAIFADIAEPVEADAVIRVPEAGENEMIIINIFPIDESGTPIPGENPLILLIQEGGQAKLSETQDGRALSAGGLYGANVVYGGGTSRVRFTVEEE